MSKKRILIVEDEAIIAMHLQSTLDGLGYDTVGLTHNASDAIRACGELRPDIILMDIVIPGGMDGIEAAKIIMNTYDIPVVYLTGNADRQTVLRARETNPYGYVIKPVNAQHLFSTIDTALNRRVLERKLRDSEDQYRRVVENMSDLISSVDRNGRYTYLSPSHTKILGYSLDDLFGMDLFEMVHPDERKEVADIYRTMVGKKPYIRGEFRCRHADGHYIWLDSTTTFLYDEDGAFDGALFSSRDITERKKAEAAIRESEERYLSLFNRSLDCIYIHDFSGNFLDANEAALNLMGYSKEEMTKLNLQSIISEEQLPLAMDMIREILVTGIQKDKKEFRLITKTGVIKYIEARGSILYHDGKPYAIQGIARDITERKKAEEELRESEARHRLITDMMSDVVWTADLELTTTYVSPSVEKILGYTVAERIGRSIIDIVSEPSAASVRALYAEEMKKEASGKADPERTLTMEIECYHKNGTLVSLENVIKAIRNDEGRAVGIHGVFRDITTQKRMVEALRVSETKLFAAFHRSPIGLSILTFPDGVYVDVNDEFLSLSGYSRDEVIGRTSIEVDVGVSREMWDQVRMKLEEEGAVRDFTIDMRTKSGMLKNVVWSGTMVSYGGRRFVLASAYDVTDRKRALEDLKQSEERFRSLFEQSSAGVFMYDRDLIVTDCNERFAAIIDAPRGSIVGRNLNQLKEERVIPSLRAALAGKSAYYEGSYQSTITGKVSWISATVSPLPGPGGEAAGAIGIVMDITNLKKAEEALEVQEKNFRAVFEQSPVGIVLFSRDLIVTDCNKRYADMMQSSREKIVGFDLRDLRDTTVVPIIRNALAGTAGYYEGPYLASTSDARLWVSFNASPLTDINGEVTGVMIVVVDITDRKKTEEALRESEERYRYLFDNANDFVFTLGLDQRFTSLNKAALDVTGYSIEEALTMTILDVLAPDYVERAREMIRKKIQDGDPTTYEVEIVAKDGRRLPLEINTQLILGDGKPVGIQGIGRDITGRRQMEEQIRRSLNDKETLLREVHHRVKNNFQVILSLINLQSEKIEDPELRKSFADAQNRIRSMVLIHEQLYKSEDISLLDSGPYVTTIVNELHSTFSSTGPVCTPRIEVESIKLIVDQAISCGLIINELVTNAYKYAFPRGWKGNPEMIVSMTEREGMIELSVSDNGTGMPPDFDPQKARTLGLSLVSMLAKQLKGSLEIRRTRGTEVIIRFRKK